MNRKVISELGLSLMPFHYCVSKQSSQCLCAPVIRCLFRLTSQKYQIHEMQLGSMSNKQVFEISSIYIVVEASFVDSVSKAAVWIDVVVVYVGL